MPKASEKKPLQFFLFSSFIGLLVALYTLWHHVAINSNSLEQASFCNVSSYVNCDAVALSSYSAIWGYPVAGLLVVFYGVLITLGIGIDFSRSAQKGAGDLECRRLRSSIFALTSLGLIASLIMAALSLFVLKLLCLLCLTSYLINFVIWGLSWKIFRENPKDEAFHILPAQSSLLASGVVAAILALSPLMMKGIVSSSSIDDKVLNTVLYQHFTLPSVTIQTEGFPSIGPKDAPIVVVEYSDFQCPYCARASAVVPQVVRASPNTRFVFKNFPLDPNCNPTMQGAGHPLACVAAKHGRCVFKIKGDDAFFRYEKSVFAQQSKLSIPLIEEIAASSSGAPQDEIKACVDSPETHAEIVAEAQEAKAVGVSGTPAVYVNGRRLEYGSVAKVLKAVLARYSESAANAGK